MKFGICAHVPQDPRILEAVADCGFTDVRLDCNWNQIEWERGKYRWDPLDVAIGRASTLGLSIYLTIAYAPRWANGSSDKAVCPQPGTFGPFFRRVVNRYGPNGFTYGIGNEVNLSDFFKGSLKQYIWSVLDPALCVCRTAGVRAVAPGLAYKGNRFADKFWWDWARAIAQHCQDYGCPSVWDQHVYAKPDNWNLARRLDGRMFTWLEGPNLKDARHELFPTPSNLYPCPPPFILGEIGYKSAGGRDNTSEVKQARQYDQLFPILEEHGKFVDTAYLYKIMDDPEEDKKWGLLRADLTKKPAWDVVKKGIAST